MHTVELLLLISLAYLLGSIPFGKLAGFYKGKDIQKHGSGNIGFANAVRVLGWQLGLLVLLADISKGLLPVLIANRYLHGYQILIVGLAAIAGHIWPVWLKFKGGKGIATGLGVTLAILPWLGLAGLAIYLAVFGYIKKSGPSSIVATWSLPLICVAFWPKYIWFYVLLALLGSWTHRDYLFAKDSPSAR